MYERNAIVLERYFSQLFGYNEKNNLKNNYANYVDLINKIEKYQEATKEEDKIIAEYDQIIGKIKEIQKIQEALYNKNFKMQESRKEIFENIDENVDGLKRKLEKLEDDFQKNNDEMKANGEAYISELAQFNEKSTSRNQCSKNRRIVEENYQNQLKETINNINGINAEKVEEVRNFFKSENNIQEEIQNKIIKNGEREKIPFDLRVMEKSIDIQTDIEEKELEILCTVYDRIHRLFAEIKNDTIKLEKHKKLIKDSECKLNFLNAMKDYLTLFLDNERLNIVGGEKEHKKLMDEAYKNLEKDMIQITNLYTLLTKEIAGKSTKKMYKDLYHPEYLYDLEEQEKEFENNISRLNVIGTVIYPDYWRIEGMQKIFASFKESIEKVYEKDLSEYEPVTVYNREIESAIIQDDDYDDIDYDEDEDEENSVGNQENEEIIEENSTDEEDDEDISVEDSKEDDEVSEEKQKEREIDHILGFYNFENDITEDDEDDDENTDNTEDDIEEQEELDDENNSSDTTEDDEEDDDYEYGFDEDDGYDDIDFDEDDEEDENEVNERNMEKNKKKK